MKEETVLKNKLKDIFKMDMQQRSNERSLHLHREIAKKLRNHSELWEIPKCNLMRWKKRGLLSPAINEWENIFRKKNRKEILSILEGNDEESIRLRSSSPFTGILDENERREIFEKYKIFKKNSEEQYRTSDRQ